MDPIVLVDKLLALRQQINSQQRAPDTVLLVALIDILVEDLEPRPVAEHELQDAEPVGLVE